MRRVYFLILTLVLIAPSSALAQQVELRFKTDVSNDINVPYWHGQSGARDVSGPYDLDGDGKMEVLATDYTAGGRIHVIENVSPDVWELVYSTPPLDSTNTASNARTVAGGDLDGDGHGEIVFISGSGYSGTNPDLVAGIHVYENVGDNDYGDAPTAMYPLDLDRFVIEQMDVADVDGDGYDEVLFANNGSNNLYDTWWVVGVTGDIGSGFETFVEELKLTTRALGDDPVVRGGGSAYGIEVADLNGDGYNEIAMQSWNNYNFTNATTNGPDTYIVPGENATDAYLNAASADQVALFGCVAVNIDGDLDDELACPNYQSGALTIVNYDPGEDVLKVKTDNVALDLIPGFSALGIAAGDMDGDGQMELFGTGPGYTNERFDAGEGAGWINVIEYNGGSVEDAASYSTMETPVFANEDYDAFTHVTSLDGTEYTTDNRVDGTDPNDAIIGNPDPELAYKMAFLGDADNDGIAELAVGIQGIQDSLYTLTEVAADSFVVNEAHANPYRFFVRIISGQDYSTEMTSERIVLPEDYKLSANYPNPFNPTTTFSFTLPIDKTVSVRIYDVQGRLVKNIVSNQAYPAGTFEVQWDGTNDAGVQVASGTYLYTLEYGNFRQTRQMVLVK